MKNNKPTIFFVFSFPSFSFNRVYLPARVRFFFINNTSHLPPPPQPPTFGDSGY